jgi:hypothetical protein
MKEAEISISAFFITLTYNTDHVPITQNGFMGLCKQDLQKYLKRLRKLNTQKLKYYAVGEYGGKTMRPHYHIIMFNAEETTISQAWKLEGTEIGEVHIGQVSEASVGYTLKYVSKDKKVPVHKNDDRLPEFSLMSKKMGSSYLTQKMVKWHKKDLLNRMYCNLKDGKKIAMPRYYKDKLYTKHQRQMIGASIQTKDTKEWLKMDLSTYEKESKKLINLAIAIARKKQNTNNEKL